MKINITDECKVKIDYGDIVIGKNGDYYLVFNNNENPSFKVGLLNLNKMEIENSFLNIETLNDLRCIRCTGVSNPITRVIKNENIVISEEVS